MQMPTEKLVVKRMVVHLQKLTFLFQAQFPAQSDSETCNDIKISRISNQQNLIGELTTWFFVPRTALFYHGILRPLFTSIALREREKVGGKTTFDYLTCVCLSWIQIN